MNPDAYRSVKRWRNGTEKECDHNKKLKNMRGNESPHAPIWPLEAIVQYGLNKEGCAGVNNRRD